MATSSMTSWGGFMPFVKRHLTWGRLYRATSYLKSALWTVPLVAIVLEHGAGALGSARSMRGCIGVSPGSHRPAQQRCIRPSSR